MRSIVPVLVLAGCASSPIGALRFRNEPAVWHIADDRDIARPSKRDFGGTLYYLDAFVVDRARSMLSIELGAHAQDVNALDEVTDSTWFTNRIGVRDVAADEVRAAASAGPAPAGPWSVTGAKIGGTEPGLVATDAHGAAYLIKFDAPGMPEMQTGADAVVQKLLWTLGYNTPHDAVVVIRRDEIVVAPTAKVKDALGDERAMTPRDLDATLARADRRPDGSYRALASQFLPGAALGGYPRAGVRPDDANDRIAHEDRRSVRGQAVFFAWLHHTDINESNSLDMWIDDGGRHYVRHYLVDFDKALGVYGWVERVETDGYLQSIELGYGMQSLVSLGLWRRPWEGANGPGLRGIGRFDTAHFDPLAWTDRYPYAAFGRLDDADGFWAARTVMRITPAQVRAAVDQGAYSDPAAAAYLTRTLIERQRMIGWAWFQRVNPLDRFRIDGDALCFDDLLRAHFTDHRRTRYVARAFDFSGAATGWRATAAGAATACVRGLRPGPGRDGYVIVELATLRGTTVAPPVRVHLAIDPATHRLRVIGIRRAP